VLQSAGSCILSTENIDDAVLDSATRLAFYMSESDQISRGPAETHGKRNKPIRTAKSDTGISSAGIISDVKTSEKLNV
jgi:hypothetical protein